MSKINIQGILNGLRNKGNAYTPVIEAVVNAIYSLEKSTQGNGIVIIRLKRDSCLNYKDGEYPKVIGFEIEDNGIGFNQINRDYFDTLYTDHKIKDGGKGFGRFMFAKYFADVHIESIFEEQDSWQLRSFVFGRKTDIVVNETITAVKATSPRTTVFLNNFISKGEHDCFPDKKQETIARKLMERLLIFFINDEYKCPRIIIEDELPDSIPIVLNDYLLNENEIIKVYDDKFSLRNAFGTEIFILKIFKFFYSVDQKSKISLIAHNREVSETLLHKYIPEFEDDFYEEQSDKQNHVTKKNYIIKSYVLGNYLNKNVSQERDSFDFHKEQDENLYPFSQATIERQVAEITGHVFGSDVKSRLLKKKDAIQHYVSNNAPWCNGSVDQCEL